MELRVARKFRIEHKIGGGNNGDIFQGTDIHTGEVVAIKLERVRRYRKHLICERVSKLINAYDICYIYVMVTTSLLHAFQDGFAKLKWYGAEGDYYILIIDLLGPNLHELFASFDRKFTLKTVLTLADQLITRFEILHSISYTHGSVKPENFAIGCGVYRNICYMIDFGRSKKYQDARSCRHIEKNENSVRHKGAFASINAGLGLPYSRRDDMQSLGYMLLYFLRGSLPWSTASLASEALHLKQTISVDELCEGNPAEFKDYLAHVESLAFEDRPDYEYMRGLFKAVFIRSDFEDDGVFDWGVDVDVLKVLENEKVCAPAVLIASAVGEAATCTSADLDTKPLLHDPAASAAAAVAIAISPALYADVSDLPIPPEK